MSSIENMESVADAVVADAVVADEGVVADEVIVDDVVPVAPVTVTPVAVAPVAADDVDSEEDVSTLSTNVSYYKNGVDYSNYVLRFLENENIFYEYIHSFTDGGSTILRIINENARISSAILLNYDTNIPVLEVKRISDANFEGKVHNSIAAWYKDINGNTLNSMFDSILIGDERVPLSHVLEVIKEDDVNINEDNSLQTTVVSNWEFFIFDLAFAIVLTSMFAIFISTL